jgi:hypothetical protein
MALLAAPDWWLCCWRCVARRAVWMPGSDRSERWPRGCSHAPSGIVMLMLRRKSALMTIHTGIAVSGYVLLLAWNALG